MFISIRVKVFLSHLLLVALLIGGLSYKNSNRQVDNYIKYVVSFYERSSLSIVQQISLSISGNNYTNIQMPMFVKELQANNKLLFMKISGVSDFSTTPYKALYSQEAGELWRVHYPIDYEQRVAKKIATLKERLLHIESDKVKINFLINRAEDSLKEYYENRALFTKYQQKYRDILSQSTPYIDTQNSIALINIETNNKNGGQVQMIFDISELTLIRKNILDTVINEAIIALALSILVLGILTARITNPINRLSSFMNRDYSELRVEDIPTLNSKDEVGILAESFSKLLQQMQGYMKRLERDSQTDSLTALYNRRSFDILLPKALETTKSKYIALLYIDIDYFKKYNDTYGHNMGDIALQKVGQSINNSLHRRGDKAFRIGGEEFAVVLSVSSNEEMLNIGYRILQNIRSLNIEHQENQKLGIITISIGAYLHQIGSKPYGISEILESSDQALYQAKRGGRNTLKLYEGGDI